MVRTPEPIKDEIQALVDDWKRSQVDPTYQRQQQIVTVDQAHAVAAKILKRKRSARVSVLALLADLGFPLD